MNLKWEKARVMGVYAGATVESVTAGCDAVAAEARRLCPVGTIARAAKAGGKAWTERRPGQLRASIRVKVVRWRQWTILGFVKAGDRQQVYYAGFVELGTAKMAAKPFLRPALRGRRDAVMQAFGRAA